VGAGNRVIVSFAFNPASGTVSCSDSGGNSYAIDKDITNGSGTTGVRTVIASAHVTTALISGNTITCTHPSVTARALSANEFSGVAATSAIDKSASATGGYRCQGGYRRYRCHIGGCHIGVSVISVSGFGCLISVAPSLSKLEAKALQALTLMAVASKLLLQSLER
jgi:hypothetical protein